jgi:uncharacterized protein YjbI with pentapeptide repeats
MSSPPTNTVSAVLLVDHRIQGYESIVSSVKQDVRCIVFDTAIVDDACKQQSITSFQYMANKIAELGVSSFSSIGIVQHNFKTPQHQFFGINPSELSIVDSVETADPTLQTWAGFASFISGLKTTYGVQNLDLMACALYSNSYWKYIIDTLAAQVQMTIRASTDDTGAAELGGNWFLESHTGVNLKSVYFTDSIDSFSGLLDMGYAIVTSSQGNFMNMIVTPSTLAVWGNSLTTTVLSAALSEKLVNITKVFSFARPGTTHNCIFALNTNGVLFGFGTRTFGTQTLNQILNVESNSGFIDYFAQNGFIGLLKSNGTVAFLTDANETNGFIYYTTLTVSNAIGVYNLVQFNSDTNRRFGVLDASGTFRLYSGPRNANDFNANLMSTVNNIARVFTGYGQMREYVLLRRNRTIAENFNEIAWTNVANIYICSFSYAGLSLFGIDTSNNLLYTSYASGYDYDNISTTNAPLAARTNVATVKTSGLGSFSIGLLLQLNGNVTGWSKVNLGSNFTFTSQNYEAVAIYITNYSWDNGHRAIQAALKYDGTLYIRGGYASANHANTYSSQPVIDVVTGLWFIAFLLNNGNVILHTSSNTFVTVVNTNNAVALYIYDDNSVNVILNDGSLVRYYNGSITYDTSVVTYNGSTTQSSTILNSNVAGVVSVGGLQSAAIRTSSSLSSFNKFDLFQYFLSRNNRRLNNFNSLNGTYTIDDYRTITLIDPFLPTTNTYTLLIPDFQSGANLVSSPYNIKSNITIGESVLHFIAAIDEGEQFTINGDTSTTYVFHRPYVYTVTTSPTFALTKVTTISAAGNGYTIYGDGAFAGVAIPAPTLSNFGPFTIANDRAFTLPTPTSNLATTYGSTWSQVGATIVGSGTYSYFGQSIAMSKDGTTIVVGAPQTTNPTKGYVGVYKNISGTWTRLGSLIYGDSQSDHFGESVSISADGTVIAVGAPQHNGFFAVGSGYVKVYKFINSVWVQQGANITGGGFNFRNGQSVSISANGKIVAMGEIGYNLVASSSGRVRLFIYDEANTTVAPIGWTQLGGDFYGPSSGSLFGLNVSLSSDGYTVAISAPQFNTTSIITGGGGAGGLVRIFQYSSSKVTNVTDISSANFGPIGWNRLGGDFYGASSSQAGGYTGLNISSDGTMIAIGYGTYSLGGINSRGLARIFKYSSSKTSNVTTINDTNFGPTGWYRLGQDLILSNAIAEDVFGASISLSTDGTVVSVCALYLDNNPPSNNNGVGGVISYSYSSSTNTWSSFGQTLYGIVNEGTGQIKTSGSGTILAIASPGGDISGAETGYVKIYNIDVSGGFTYSSTNTSIADVYSSIVIPRGNGTAIVRAEQSGYGGYINKTISANVTVQSSAPTYTYTVSNPQSITKTFGVDTSFSLTDVMAGVSNSSGAYTFSSASGAISISGSVATILAYTPSAITITVSQDASGSYSAGSTTISLLVNRGTPTYQSVSQVTKTFGVDASFSLSDVMTGISSSTGEYTFSSTSTKISITDNVATILAYTPSAVTINVSQAASANYNAGSTTFSLLIARGTPNYQNIAQVSKIFGIDVSFSLAAIVAGKSNSDGAYTFTSTSAAISISGDVVTILSYTPSEIAITASQDASGNYNASSTSIPLLINRATPTYQSVSQITKTFGTDISFSILAQPGVAGMSNSDGVYSLFSTTSDAISIVGDVVTILAYTPSPITITASQDASGNYASSSNTLSLLINRGAPTYTPISQITKTFGTDASFSLSPLVANLSLSNSSGAFTFSSASDAVSISGDVVSILAYTPSAIYITTNQEASGNYTSGSTNNSISLLVNRKVPAYGAFTLPAVTYEDAPYSFVALNLAPTSESNATYSYSSSDPAVATVNSDGTVVTIVGQGTTTITVSQDASGNYAAGSTTASLLVNRAAPTFLKTFTITDKTFGDASFSLLPFTVGLDNTDGTYTFSSANTSVVSIDGEFATVLAYSATPITIYVAVDACGNYAASSTSGTLTINRAAPTYQSVSTVAKTFGDAPFSLSDVMSGISNSSGSYTFTSSDVSAVSIGVDGVTATILAYKASAITITASQEASGNYTSGTTTFSLTVARATPTIGTLSLGPLNGYYDVSDNYFTLTAPTSNSLGAFTYTSDNTNVAVVSNPTIHNTSLIAHYDPSDPANYEILGGVIQYLKDLTRNNRPLYRFGTGYNVVTVGSKQMLNCLNSNSGYNTINGLILSNTTLFMVIRYNPTNTTIPNLAGFYQHGGRDTDLSILKGSSTHNIILKSNNNNSASISLVPNTSYVLISRVNGSLRELWAYSEDGNRLYASDNNTTFNNISSYMYIGTTNAGEHCRSYIGEIMVYNSALTNSDISNNISFLQEKWFGVSGSEKVVRFLTSGNANITATQDICGNYGTGSTSSLLRVGATVPTFGTFTVSSTTKTYGDGPFTLTPPSSNSNGAFTFSSSNSSVISISGTTATIVGGGPVSITATQDPSGSFTRKSVTTEFAVQGKNPNLRNFASVVRSYASGSLVMTAPETDGPGSFIYSSSNSSIVSNISGSANFTIVAGGTVTITAVQTATANYTSASITTTVTITPIAPTASYSNFNRPYNLGTFTIPAPTTSSNGTISYVSSDTSVATVEGSTVVIKKVGDTTITASIAATSTYLARDISAIFSVVRGTPTMSGLSNQTVAMTQQPYTMSPTSNSTGTFSYVSDNSAIVFMTNNGTTFNVAGVGTATITATISQDASGNFNSRTSVFTITVIRATSNLSTNGTFSVPTSMTFGDTPVNSITLPTSNSNGAITYSSANTNVATIHPTTGVITAVGAGLVYFIATQAQTNVYNSNTLQSNYIQILPKTITHTRAEPYTSSTITKYYGDSSFSLGTVSESNASRIFSVNNSSVVTVNTVGSSANISIVNVGSVDITAQQSGNSQYITSNTLTWTLTVEKGNTTLTGLAATLSKNVTDAPFSLSVSSQSSGVKSYALSSPDSSNVLTVNPTTGFVTLKGPGTATVVASQAASSLYNAPPNVSCVITVTEAGSALQGSTITGSRVFENVDMSGASLSGTTVSGTSFAGTSLVNAVMTSITVTNTEMTSVNLTGASMANAVVNGSTFSGATMSSVVMTGATVRNSTMTTVNLASASMANSDVSGTTFAGATMTNVVMTGATVRNSTMSSVNLTSASMANTTITGTTFASATMTNAVLTGATLTDSTLTSTILTGASLSRANVSGSSFVGATLTNADLSGATVTNANFTNANISGANITNVAFSPLQKIQLLKNSSNRAIGGIQVSDVSGSTILSAISVTSPAASIPNIANAVVKVVIPQTSTNPADTISNVVLDTTTSDKFYFPINEGEYFQISGVKYYTSNGIVKNYDTDEVVEVISYGSKSIWLIAGSIIANVLDTNTISQSTFTVPSKKLDTDAPFNITVAPTSNSDAPIVYSSNHTSVATIHPTTGLITIISQGYVSFTATQAATLMYEAGSKTSNEMFVNKLIDFTLTGLNQTILMSTSGLLDASAVSLETTDATAVFYVKVSDMTNVFKIQTDSNDMNDSDASDVKYYVFNRLWPAELKINPAHAMMNKIESNGMLGTTDLFTSSKMLAKHDFLRYLALRLFNTIHGVDLFSNESDLLENTAYWGEDVNANIRSTMANISTTSSDESMSYDASGNKYLTNAATGNTNLCRELVRQLTANVPSRFGSITDANTPQSIPLMEDDSINFKVTFQSAPSQNVLTGVTEIPSRSYMVKLVLKNSISGLNTVVTDSEMYPNSYPYSSSVVTYAPTSASSAVYNVYSPPAPIPFARFGFDGWYYTNSSAWVTSSSRNHVKWLLPASSGESSTVGSLRYIRANLKIHNKTSTPFIVVYTQSGSWRKYPVLNNNTLVNGTAYSFYVNFNSYSSAPAVIGFTNEALIGSVGAGSFGSGEVILNIALETSSTAAVGTVDFTLASMIVGEETNEKEYGFEADVPASYA